jgi:type II secretory pathway pseudopilin PulG
MRRHARSEGGFLTVELVVAIVVITIALLALMGAYEQSFFSIHTAAKTSAAGQLAENQLELYASLPYSSVGLDSSTLTTKKATDTNYSSDESALSGTGSDATISGCGSSAQCSPVQTLTGSDGKSYKLETFIRLLSNPNAPTGTTWNEKVVTLVVRDLSTSGYPKVLTIQTAIDHGPSS